jgi:tetracycline resistance efflux pump
MWYYILPPAVVLLMSFWYKDVNKALLAGLATAALLVTSGNPLTAAQLLAIKAYNQITDFDNLMVFLYLPLLGYIISLIIKTGGATAWGNYISDKVHSRRGIELATLGFSSCFFLDDYFSSWTVGTVMHSVTDRFKVPRVKLAYLINMLAPCMAILSPISSWIAVILSQMIKVGINDSSAALVQADPFMTYLSCIGYLLYPCIAVLATWFLVAARISYGPMAEQEKIAQETGNVFGGKDPVASKISAPTQAGALFDFLLPICLLIGLTPPIILWTGGFWMFGGTNALGPALTAANIFLAMVISALVTGIISTCYFFFGKHATSRLFFDAAIEGTQMMAPSFILLFLAWNFSDFLRNDLPAGKYLASAVAPALPLALVPAIFYLLSGITAFGTGTAWGTLMVMTPIVIPMVIELSQVTTPATLATIPMLLPTLGAIFSGTVAGTHLSPIADNTIVSSFSSACHHVDHVRAQIPYVLPMILAAGIGFAILGVCTVFQACHPLLWAWLISLVIAFATYLAFRRNSKN